MDVFLLAPSTTDQNNSELERRQVFPENRPLTIIYRPIKTHKAPVHTTLMTRDWDFFIINIGPFMVIKTLLP